jgi:phage gp16-like protein
MTKQIKISEFNLTLSGHAAARDLFTQVPCKSSHATLAVVEQVSDVEM